MKMDDSARRKTAEKQNLSASCMHGLFMKPGRDDDYEDMTKAALLINDDND